MSEQHQINKFFSHLGIIKLFESNHARYHSFLFNYQVATLSARQSIFGMPSGLKKLSSKLIFCWCWAGRTFLLVFSISWMLDKSKSSGSLIEDCPSEGRRSLKNSLRLFFAKNRKTGENKRRRSKSEKRHFLNKFVMLSL